MGICPPDACLLNRHAFLVDKVDNGMAHEYALRIDLDGVDVPAIGGFLDQHCTRYYAVREGGTENPHVHIYCRSDKALGALRKAVQRFLSGDRGNAAYSLKACADDVSGYHKYLCKGDSSSVEPDVCLRHGLEYTDEWPWNPALS